MTNNISTAAEKVLQIGEGNFLRAFADYILELANRSGVYSGRAVIVQPIENGKCEKINEASGRYTVLMRGIENGQLIEKAEKINSVSRCINPYVDYASFLECAKNPNLEIVISNTTESGIAFSQNDKYTDTPPAAFPAKMTVFLHKRYEHFDADPTKGLLFLPAELIDDNGKMLKNAVLFYAELWKLGANFISWIEESCCFANTLVDRIVTGFPHDEQAEIFEKLGYEDPLLVACEPFLFWAIECPEQWAERFPIDKLGLDIIYSRDISPYRLRKVRILNGAHTLSVLEAYLAGHETVLDMMNDDYFNEHIKYAMFNEIMPILPLPLEELEGFAAAVLERFANPFIRHRLLDISLNSVSKFKARCLPSLLEYFDKFGRLPKALCRALAALIAFYNGEWQGEQFMGERRGEMYEIRDDKEILQIFSSAHKSDDPVLQILSNVKLWGKDLLKIEGLYELVKENFGEINA